MLFQFYLFIFVLGSSPGSALCFWYLNMHLYLGSPVVSSTPELEAKDLIQALAHFLALSPLSSCSAPSVSFSSTIDETSAYTSSDYIFFNARKSG